jgi:hypothetical protein
MLQRLESFRLMQRHLGHLRLEQSLDRRLSAELALHALVQHALVRRMGIHQHEPGRRLSDDVHTMQLRDRRTEHTVRERRR